MRRWLIAWCVGLATLCPGSGRADEAFDPPTEENWERVRDTDGIQVSRVAGAAGDRPSFRGETVIEAQLFEVLAVLADDPRRTEWMSRCIESRRLELREDGARVSYNRTRGLWPVADRDAVVEARTVVSPDRTEATVRLRAVESDRMRPLEGVVRLPAIDGSYHLTVVAPDRTRVVYQMSIDLGGRIPDFIADRVSSDMPFDTLNGLRDQVTLTKIEYAADAQKLRETLPAVAAPPPSR